MDISSTGKYKFPCGCELPVINKTIKQSDGLPSLEIDYYSLPLNCEGTWELLKEGKTKGVFQLETNLGRAWARRILPNNIEDLGALISLMRPGCLKAISEGKSMTQHYADRKHGLEPVKHIHPSIHEILKDTYQVGCYQEQNLKIAQKVAGFDLKKSGILRRAAGKKDPKLMTEVENMFIEGVKEAKVVTEAEGREI